MLLRKSICSYFVFVSKHGCSKGFLVLIRFKKIMIMKRYLIIYLLLLSPLFVFAKTSVGNQKIKGVVKTIDGKPIEGAVVSCLSLPDSALVENAITDSVGRFFMVCDKETLNDIALYVSCIGYENQLRRVNTGNDEDVLISLKENVHQLKGVTVTTKSVVKGIPGGFSFTPGGAEMLLPDGFELLKIAPMLDVRGGVSIIGKGYATIYINGRDPHMPENMVLEMLRTVEPKNIKRIDIVYNPGSSQKASDQSGIVNVVMKRPDYGWMGTASISALTQNGRVTEIPEVYIGYGHGRLKFSANVKVADARGVTKKEKRYEYKTESLGVTNSMWRKYNTVSGGINANATYDITDKSQVGVSVGTSMLGGSTRNETSVVLSDGKTGTVKQGKQVEKVKAPFRFPSYSLVAFYSLQTDKRGSNLDVNATYSNSKRKSTEEASISSDLGMDSWLSSPYFEKDRSARHRFGVEANYTEMFADKSVLKFGGAYDISHVDEDNHFSDVVDGGYVNNTKRSNRFVYDENVAGLYVNYTREWAKFFNSSLGLRVEQTHTHGDQRATGETFTRDYWQLFPNVSLSFNTLNNKHIFGIDYSVFVWRPEYSRLNPFKYWTSQNTYDVGNPGLDPGKTHFLTFSYRFLQWYEFSVEGTIVPHNVNSYTVQDGNGVSKTGYGDLGRARSIRFVLNAYRSLFGGRWYIKAHASAGYGRREGKVDVYPLNEHSWSFSGYVYNTVFLNKARDFMFNTLYSFSAARHEGSETRPAKHIVSLSVSKSFRFGGSVSLDFSGTFPWKDKTFYENSTYYYQTRNLTSPTSVAITFQQRFGKKRVRGASVRSDHAFEARQK